MSRLSRSTSLAVPLSPSPSPSSSSVRCLPFFTRSQTPLGRLFGICLASGCVSLKCSTCHLVLHKRQTEGGKWDFLFLWLSLSQSGSLSLLLGFSLSLSALSSGSRLPLSVIWGRVCGCNCNWNGLPHPSPALSPPCSFCSDMPGMPRAPYEYQFWRQLLLALTKLWAEIEPESSNRICHETHEILFDFSLSRLLLMPKQYSIWLKWIEMV